MLVITCSWNPSDYDDADADFDGDQDDDNDDYNFDSNLAAMPIERRQGKRDSQVPPLKNSILLKMIFYKTKKLHFPSPRAPRFQVTDKYDE